MIKYWIGLTLNAIIVQLVCAQILMPERRHNIAVKSDPNLSYRLPNNTKPEAYYISLKTNIHSGDFNFKGSVIIVILAVESTTSITLHHRQLTIKSVTLLTTPNPVFKIPIEYPPKYDNNTELLKIQLKNGTRLAAGKRYILEIRYEGILRNDRAGFYRSSYKDAAGNTRWLATTQFEETDARHAFPCYDEPALKANFAIQITHDKSYNALSNMPERRKEKANNTVTTYFDTTPKMAPYALAFVVSDFPSLSNNKKPFKHRTFAKPTLVNETKSALEVGEKVLDGLATYLGIPYALPKMDQIAIPDFEAGAMENWGLITYSEPAFIWTNISKFPQLNHIYSIIAHEMAHQYFGNLVTPKWWTYLWLNEGFASYFGYKGIDMVYPAMGIMDFYVISNVHTVLDVDAKSTTRPMTHYVEDPLGVSMLFDDISYGKAGAVIRMFSHAFTENSFKKGLHYYLKAKQYSDVTEEDLFDNLEKAVKEDKTLDESFNVETIMKSWSHAKGYPILNVKVLDEGIIEIDQQHYLNGANEQPNDNLWWIPYNFVTANDEDERSRTSTAPDGWFSTKRAIIIPTTNRSWTKDDWVVFNKEQTGYYRIMYDSENYKKIGDALAENGTILHYLTKAQLLDDVSNFIETGQLKYDIFLSLVRMLKHERHFAPWKTALGHLIQINNRLIGSPHFIPFEGFLRDLIANFYDSTGVNDIENESQLLKYGRDITVKLACAKGLKECLEQTRNRLIEVVSHGKEVHPNIRLNLYCAALRSAEDIEYRYVWRRALTTNDTDMRYDLLEALTCTLNENLLKELVTSTLINTTTDGMMYRDTEAIDILTNSLANKKGLYIIMDFLRDNANEFRKSYSSDDLQMVFEIVGSKINTKAQLKYLKDIMKALDDPIDDDSIPIEEATKNLKWNDVHFPVIKKWIDENLADYAA